MTTEGTINLPFDLAEHMADCLRASEAEPDPHIAFHLRSAMPIPSWLCVQCGGSDG